MSVIEQDVGRSAHVLAKDVHLGVLAVGLVPGAMVDGRGAGHAAIGDVSRQNCLAAVGVDAA